MSHFPITTCSGDVGVYGSKPMEFGTSWGGRTSSQQEVEAVSSVRTVEGKTPYWGDYLYATFSNNAIQRYNLRVVTRKSGW